MIRVLKFSGLLSVLGLLGLLPALAGAAESTAFQLIKEGNRYLGEQARNKVVQVRSERSVTELAPIVWYVAYYDPTVSSKVTEVKFGAGRMLTVKRPSRLFEPIVRREEPLDLAKLKIDSDKAIKLAAAEPLLEKLTLKATALKLEHSKEGPPVWRVKIWAAKLRDPADSVYLGEVTLSAEDGKVVKTDLKVNRVD